MDNATDPTDCKRIKREHTASPSIATSTLSRVGPFAPDDEQAARNGGLTQCNNCGWYCSFDEKDENKNKKRWCHACGRLIVEDVIQIEVYKDTKKNSSSASSRESTRPSLPWPDYEIGSKSIHFQISTRDPRDSYPKWKDLENTNSGWIYNVQQMEHDFFSHCIGLNPTISQILSCMVTKSNDLNGDSSISDTNSLKFYHSNDEVFFQELGRHEHSDRISHTLDAKWDNTKRKGEITVSLSVSQTAFFFNPYLTDSHDSPITYLLGAFFDVFPFQLFDLISLPAKEILPSNNSESIFLRIKTEEPHAQGNHHETTVNTKQVFDTYNEAANTIRSRHHFLSSSGTLSGGGVSCSDRSFAGLLKRYFREKIIQDVLVAEERMKKKKGFLPGTNSSTMNEDRMLNGFQSYIVENEQALLTTNLRYAINETYERYSSFDGLMQQLENLGHTSVDNVKGLNVELLPFQKETVAWIVEREQYGYDNYLWAKVPGADLYFSPILDQFHPVYDKFMKRDTPLPIRRGGFIAEESGMGKTVISLAVMITNTAPPLPKSGSLISKWSSTATSGNCANQNEYSSDNSNEKTSYWPIGKCRKSDEKNQTKANIVSRGTLIVCNPKMVGHWIEEAKSKLTNPVISSYHGPKRDKNAKSLAMNDIVITTYRCLASEAFGDKIDGTKQDKNYCPPCEEIHWWRIIFDSSHLMKNESTDTHKAVVRLSAAHKWCSTATPFNSSLNDLKSQMKLIDLHLSSRIMYINDIIL